MSYSIKVESASDVTTDLICLDYLVSISESESELYNRVTIALVQTANAWDDKWDELIPLSFHEGTDQVKIQCDPMWLGNLAHLVWELESGDLDHPKQVYLAWLKDKRWELVDFDEIESWAEEYVPDSDDPQEYALAFDAEHNIVHESIVEYVDYEAWGSDMISDFTTLDWSGHKYPFSI